MNIPNIPPYSPVVDEKGFRTSVEQVFMDQLLKELTMNAGPEGLVAPTLDASQIIQVQNNTNIDGEFTCQYGTIIYNSTANSMMMAINDGTNKPVFLTVTLT
jgi:hypothetical protein